LQRNFPFPINNYVYWRWRMVEYSTRSCI